MGVPDWLEESAPQNDITQAKQLMDATNGSSTWGDAIKAVQDSDYTLSNDYNKRL